MALPRGWRSLTSTEATALERELRREMPRGHLLYDCALRALARRDDRDDVAFDVFRRGLCVVHLTWRAEADPQWPHAAFVDALVEDDQDE